VAACRDVGLPASGFIQKPINLTKRCDRLSTGDGGFEREVVVEDPVVEVERLAPPITTSQSEKYRRVQMLGTYFCGA
jgi:hypothetical protein